MPFLWTFLGLLLLALVYSAIEQRFLKVTEYELTFDKLKAEKKGFTFVVLSDLHNNSFGKNNRKLIRRITELKPDFIVTAGDMVTKGQRCSRGNAYELMKSLAELYPVYYAIGNHEQHFIMLSKEGGHIKLHLLKSWQEFRDRLNGMGVIFLDNETITAEYGGNVVSITGISIEGDYYGKGKASGMEKDYISGLTDRRPEYEFKLMIAHNPVYFSEYAEWGANLIVSGHIHGGLIRLGQLGGLISPQYRFFPKYDSGLYEDYGSTLIVSRGLGTHSFMPRLFNRPELIYVRITGGQ